MNIHFLDKRQIIDHICILVYSIYIMYTKYQPTSMQPYGRDQKGAFMDRRIQRTRNSLFSAFIELRAVKPIEKITVKELTEKANISKQTFYLHFQDIYDLSEYLENDALQSLIGDIPNPEYMLTNPAEASRQLCNAFINQGHLFSILFPDDSRSYGVLTNKLDALIKEKIYDERPEFRDDLSKNVEVSMFVQGCAYTLLKYKDQDVAKVIDTLAGIIERAVRE